MIQFAPSTDASTQEYEEIVEQCRKHRRYQLNVPTHDFQQSAGFQGASSRQGEFGLFLLDHSFHLMMTIA